MGGPGKGSMKLINVEAYAVPSSYLVSGDSHCFVVTEDKVTSWTNHGRGWSGEGETKVAVNRAYKEWLWEFVPPSNVDKCGIDFLENGVCQTFANRELLIGEDAADVSKAAKNYVCVVFFGKYGMGLKQLKQLLTDSYNKIMISCSDPYNALNKVLARVDDTVDDELRAWRQVGIEYCHIPIDEIMAKSPHGGLVTARGRMTRIIEKREKIYQDFIDSHKEGGDKKLYKDIWSLIQSEVDDYLNMLADIGYITQSEKRVYSHYVDVFLESMLSRFFAQRMEFLRTGRIVEDFRMLENLNGEAGFC